MFSYQGSETVALTPELALKCATMKCWSGERPFSKKREKFLSEQMAAGRFHGPTWAFATHRETGETYRVNGQHSSSVLVDAEEFPKNLTVTIHRYEFDSITDLPFIFEQWDNQVSARSHRDAQNAHAKSHPELKAVAKLDVSRAVDGIARYHELNGTSVPCCNRALLIDENVQFVLWLQSLVDGMISADCLFKPPIVAAQFATYLCDKDIALTYWGMIRDETHHDPASLTREMARYLREGRFRGATRLDRDRNLYNDCIRGFNRYCRGNDEPMRKTRRRKARVNRA